MIDLGLFKDASPAIRAMVRDINRYCKENAEYNSLFKLQRKRTLEADKLWQEANKKPDVFPDLGELLAWLMRERESKNALIRQMLEATIKTCCKWYCGEGFDDCEHCDIFKALEAARKELGDA